MLFNANFGDGGIHQLINYMLGLCFLPVLSSADEAICELLELDLVVITQLSYSVPKIGSILLQFKSSLT